MHLFLLGDWQTVDLVCVVHDEMILPGDSDIFGFWEKLTHNMVHYWVVLMIQQMSITSHVG